MIPSFILFPLAICAVLIPSTRIGHVSILPWLLLYLLANVFAVAVGAVTPFGLTALAVLFGLAWAASRSTGLARFVLIVLFIALAVAFSTDKVPGAGKLTWPDAIPLGPPGASFTPSFNVGKVSAGLLMYALLVPRVSSVAEVRRFWKPTLAIGIVGTSITVGAALALGYLHFDPKLPPATAAYLASNLLFTCVAEEALARGLLQESMHRAAERSQRPAMHVVAVVVSAVIFGIGHLHGGWHFVVLATLGGLTNALVYAKARKVEASIVTHFMLNAAHFLFLTYPGLGR